MSLLYNYTWLFTHVNHAHVYMSYMCVHAHRSITHVSMQNTRDRWSTGPVQHHRQKQEQFSRLPWFSRPPSPMHRGPGSTFTPVGTMGEEPRPYTRPLPSGPYSYPSMMTLGFTIQTFPDWLESRNWSIRALSNAQFCRQAHTCWVGTGPWQGQGWGGKDIPR